MYVVVFDAAMVGRPVRNSLQRFVFKCDSNGVEVCSNVGDWEKASWVNAPGGRRSRLKALNL
jgi:hypothetical protein